MAMIKKGLLEIVVCPFCHSHLDFLDGRLVCLGKDCSRKFLVKEGIPILLGQTGQNTESLEFKKSQVKFFDHWSSKERGKKRKGNTYFDQFFSPLVGEKKINYSEESMRDLVSHLPKNSLILELGCGAGEHTAFLARLREDLHILVIDLSLKSAIETRERIKSDKKIKSKVSVLVADGENLPFKNGVFSGIMAVMFFHHMACLQKTLEEMKRTLHRQGTGLIVDIVSNNPFVVLPRNIFPFLPSPLKRKFSEDYLLTSGEMPQVSPHKIEEIKSCIRANNLKLVKERNYDLFLFLFSYLGTIFPPLKHLLPKLILDLLYALEKRLLQIRFFQQFSGAVALWFSL